MSQTNPSCFRVPCQSLYESVPKQVKFSSNEFHCVEQEASENEDAEINTAVNQGPETAEDTLNNTSCFRPANDKSNYNTEKKIPKKTTVITAVSATKPRRSRLSFKKEWHPLVYKQYHEHHIQRLQNSHSFNKYTPHSQSSPSSPSLSSSTSSANGINSRLRLRRRNKYHQCRNVLSMQNRQGFENELILSAKNSSSLQDSSSLNSLSLSYPPRKSLHNPSSLPSLSLSASTSPLLCRLNLRHSEESDMLRTHSQTLQAQLNNRFSGNAHYHHHHHHHHHRTLNHHHHHHHHYHHHLQPGSNDGNHCRGYENNGNGSETDKLYQHMELNIIDPAIDDITDHLCLLTTKGK
eukprot:Awhi_evm1s13916